MEKRVVKLTIRDSSQVLDDETLMCDENWQIAQLKEHLSDLYPSKPVSITCIDIDLYTLKCFDRVSQINMHIDGYVMTCIVLSKSSLHSYFWDSHMIKV